MTTHQPFDVPEKVIIDPLSGYAVNIPVENQEPSGWWEDDAIRSRFLDIRADLGIELEDALTA